MILAPTQKRVLDIDVTSACDMACANCTRLVYFGPKVTMTPANFRLTLETLRDWPELGTVTHGGKNGHRVSGHRVIAMIGGNPCVAKEFPEWCEIFREVIPQKQSRGLWTNRLLGHGKIARETFGYYNLNCHGNLDAAKEMSAELPGVTIYGDPRNPGSKGGHSTHQPFMNAKIDLDKTDIPLDKWVENCPVAESWSGSILPFDMPDGSQKVFAYFCEIQATFERIYGLKTGIPVEMGWWQRRPLANHADYQAQISEWCNRCGAPFAMDGIVDSEKSDDVSAFHREKITELAVKRKRKVNVLTDLTVRGHNRKPWTSYDDVRRDRAAAPVGVA